MKIFTLIALLLCSLAAQSAEVVVRWTAPVANTNGSVLAPASITGFEVWQATSTTATFTLAETALGTAREARYQKAPGNHCFFVKTAVGTARSAGSNPTCVTVPADVVIPGVPTNVTVIVVTVTQ